MKKDGRFREMIAVCRLRAIVNDCLKNNSYFKGKNSNWVVFETKKYLVIELYGMGDGME